VAHTLRDGVVISADTALLSNVAIRDVSEGMRIGQRNRAAPTPGSLVRVTRGVIDSVLFGNGLTVTGIDQVTVESTTVANVFNGGGIFVDPTNVLALRADTLRNIFNEALRTDSVRTVSLVGLHISGSAQPSFQRFGASIFAVTIAHADSVRIDSTAVVDNLGGGILVDSARVVHGDGTTIARNLGLRAQICEFGCEVLPNGPARSHTPYATSQAPGLALAAVQTAQLDRFVVDSNPFGGIDAAMALLSGPTLTIQGGLIRGGLYSILATGDLNAPSGAISVDGTQFANTEGGITASHFTDFSLTGARLDSIPYRQSRVAVQINDVANVTFTDDTLSGGVDAGIRVDGSNVVAIRRVAIRGFRDSCGECGDFALSLNAIQTSALVYGGRLEQNEISGASVGFGSAATITFDSMVVIGHNGRGLQLQSPTTVRQNVFQGNGTGISLFGGAEGSTIVNNNFVGNTSFAVANGIGSSIDVPNNWWNDPLGPSGCTTCNVASTGDPVSELVNYAPVLGAPYGPAPLPAPRRLSRGRP
jgi:parallel beta-helix repeat protein